MSFVVVGVGQKLAGTELAGQGLWTETYAPAMYSTAELAGLGLVLGRLRGMGWGLAPAVTGRGIQMAAVRRGSPRIVMVSAIPHPPKCFNI